MPWPCKAAQSRFSYLTVFAAFRLYHVLAAAPTFGLLVAIAALSAAIAILQNSMAVAVLASPAVFSRPSSRRRGRAITSSSSATTRCSTRAFSRSPGIAPGARSLVGFAFTFVIGIAWGVLRYRPELFASTEPFLILFFLFYS